MPSVIFADCRVSFIVVLNVIMLGAFMLSVVAPLNVYVIKLFTVEMYKFS
jgi:hypothetical protein